MDDVEPYYVAIIVTERCVRTEGTHGGIHHEYDTLVDQTSAGVVGTVVRQISLGQLLLSPFGKADIKRAGSDVTILTFGAVLYRALKAADELKAKYGIN